MWACCLVTGRNKIKCNAKVHVQFFFLCGFTPENNDQFCISTLSLIIRSEWVLCKTKLKIWLFTALSPSMQIINHSDIKSIVCSFFDFWDMIKWREVCVGAESRMRRNRLSSYCRSLIESRVVRVASLGAKTNNCPFQFKRRQQAHSDYGSDDHKNSLFYLYASVFRATVAADCSCPLLNRTCLF